MLDLYYTKKILGLQEVTIKNIDEKEERYEIFIDANCNLLLQLNKSRYNNQMFGRYCDITMF